MSPRAVLRLAPRAEQTPAIRPAPPVQVMARAPLQLRPIPWGTRDRELARGVCRLVLEHTPPTVIPFDPRTHARMRKDLRSLGIHH